jgi:hypothetical protein
MGDLRKVGQITNLSIPAGKSVQINQDGTNAYVVVCSAAGIEMRARTKVSAQAYSTYGAGQGFKDTEFTSVELFNPSAVPVVVSVWVGRASFDDHRLILANAATPNVARPTYPDPAGAPAANVNINDISGTGFTDINGNLWLALYRVMILISNLDGGVVLLVQESGGTGASPAILAVQPLTDRAIPVSGDYTMNNGGGNLNCIVSEIYAAIPA